MVIYIWWYIFAGRAKKKINFTFSQIPGRQNIILYILLFNTLDSQKSIFPHFPDYCKNLFSACAKLYLCSGLSLFAVLRPKNRTKRCNSLWDKHFPRFLSYRSLLWGQILLWWQEWVLSSYAVCTSTAAQSTKKNYLIPIYIYGASIWACRGRFWFVHFLPYLLRLVYYLALLFVFLFSLFVWFSLFPIAVFWCLSYLIRHVPTLFFVSALIRSFHVLLFSLVSFSYYFSFRLVSACFFQFDSPLFCFFLYRFFLSLLNTISSSLSLSIPLLNLVSLPRSA